MGVLDMNEDFVSFNLAKKLKEKGYPQAEKNALVMYNEDGEWHSLSPTLDDFYYDFRDFDENDCVCPTISQVLKWLREEKDVDLVIYPIFIYKADDRAKEYHCKIYAPQLNKPIPTDEYRNRYESVALDGIKYVLDNLI